jgi:hypothetical protein
VSQRRSSPSSLFSRAEDALKLSDDIIEADFIITPDSRIWDLSPMHLGAAKTARESAKSPDEFEARPASSLSFKRSVRPSIMRRAVRVFAQVRFRFWIRAAMLNTRFHSTKRSESCDAVIRIYDAAGNVIETHEHAGEFKAW